MRHGADKYLTKPSTIEGLNATVEKLVAVISENALD
jgi:DNA-binding response OmpR family regulator